MIWVLLLIFMVIDIPPFPTKNYHIKSSRLNVFKSFIVGLAILGYSFVRANLSKLSYHIQKYSQIWPWFSNLNNRLRRCSLLNVRAWHRYSTLQNFQPFPWVPFSAYANRIFLYMPWSIFIIQTVSRLWHGF